MGYMHESGWVHNVPMILSNNKEGNNDDYFNCIIIQAGHGTLHTLWPGGLRLHMRERQHAHDSIVTHFCLGLGQI